MITFCHMAFLFVCCCFFVVVVLEMVANLVQFIFSILLFPVKLRGT